MDEPSPQTGKKMGNVKSGKYRDAVRTSLTESLSDVFEANFPLVAEIVEADVRKDDAYLIKMAKTVIADIERKIKVLEDKQ